MQSYYHPVLHELNDIELEEQKQVRIIKIIFVFVIFAIGLGSGILPAKVPSCGKNKTFMGMANAFSGGLFLAIALVHVLPEVTDQYDKITGHYHPNQTANTTQQFHLQPNQILVQHENHLHLLEDGRMQDTEEAPHHFLGHLTSAAEEEPFPLPFVLVFAGYSFILLIDRVMFDSHALFEHGEEGHGDGKGGHDHHESKLRSTHINNSKEITGQNHQHQLLEGGHDRISHSHKHSTADPAAHIMLEKIKHAVEKIHHDEEPNNTYEREIVEEEEILAEKEIQENIKSYLSRNDQFALRMKKSMQYSDNHQKQDHLFVDSENAPHGENKGVDNDADHNHGKCNMTPIILMVALSVHAIFEGIALGILPEMKESVNLMISIVIHKCAEGMSICIAMQKSGMEFKQVFKFLSIFASATPLGTVIGILLSGMSDIINIVFMSIAGGSFIYVSCSELIVEEFSLPGNRWLKLLAFLLGAALIGGLLAIE